MTDGSTLLLLTSLVLVGCARTQDTQPIDTPSAIVVPDVKAVPVYFSKQYGSPAPPACALPYEATESAGWEEWPKVLVVLQMTPSGVVESVESVQQVTGQDLSAETLQALAKCAGTTRLDASHGVPSTYSFWLHVRPS